MIPGVFGKSIFCIVDILTNYKDMKTIFLTICITFFQNILFAQNVTVIGGDPNILDGEYEKKSADFYQCIYNSGCAYDGVIVKLGDRWILHPMFDPITFENFNLTVDPPCTEWQVVPGNGGMTPPVLGGGCFVLNPLPIQLLNFNARQSSPGLVALEWEYKASSYLAGFSIEHSTDNLRWEEIAVVEETNVSTDEKKHEFIHKHAVNGINYYRLQILNHDGSFVYSKVIVTRMTDHDRYIVFPNPAKDHFKITGDADGEAILLDHFGRRLGGKIKIGEIIDISTIPKGVYVLCIQHGDRLNTIRIMKQ